VHGEILIRSINQKLGNFRHTRRPVAKPSAPKPLQDTISVESSSSSGVTGVSIPPCTPLGCHFHNISARKIFKILLKACLYYVTTTPATSYWHQGVNLWSALSYGITLTMAWPDCLPAVPDEQRGAVYFQTNIPYRGTWRKTTPPGSSPASCNSDDGNDSRIVSLTDTCPLA
jgi:hypothetical protein